MYLLKQSYFNICTSRLRVGIDIDYNESIGSEEYYGLRTIAVHPVVKCKIHRVQIIYKNLLFNKNKRQQQYLYICMFFDDLRIVVLSR